MKKTKSWKIILLLVIILGCSHLFSKNEPVNLKPEQIKMTVDSLALFLKNNYVITEKADQLEKMLLDNQKKGVYNNISDPIALTGKLTQDIVGLTKDRHLSVNYDPERISYMTQQKNNDGEAAKLYYKKIAQNQNYGFKEIKILPGNIGYIKFDNFESYPEAFEIATGAMAFVNSSKALILDLRDNGGGNSEMIQYLCSYFFDQPGPILINTFYYRPADIYTHSYTLPYVSGAKFINKPIYILTSGRTFSAAEEFTYDLKNMKRAIIVGETTGGGAHPIDEFVLNENIYAVIATGKAINPITKTNWEGVGVIPDISVERNKALDKAHSLALDSISVTEKDPDVLFQLKWLKEINESKVNPTILDTKYLRTLAGLYGPRKVMLNDNSLSYQRENGPVYKLIPMGRDLFRIEEIPYFRLHFVINNDKTVGLEGQYDDGRKDYNEKNK